MGAIECFVEKRLYDNTEAGPLETPRWVCDHEGDHRIRAFTRNQPEKWSEKQSSIYYRNRYSHFRVTDVSE